MPLTVITLKNSTPSLRGDLSKWMQEIATGVYIGNFNSRIREYLWARVIENVGIGEATLSYSSRNEIGYDFETYNTKREVASCDGISLVMFPVDSELARNDEIKLGFSDAYKLRKQRQFNRLRGNKTKNRCVMIDIETDGLELTNNILEIAAIKINEKGVFEFCRQIKPKCTIPKYITELTGLTYDYLYDEGILIEEALNEFCDFIDGSIIVGYNVVFDIKFINSKLKEMGLATLSNKSIDLLPLVKKENMFLDNYKLETVLAAYKIGGTVKHRALDDVRQITELASKLKKFDELLDI